MDLDWRGGIGAVGEKSSLHRQASLPTKYHRGEMEFNLTMIRCLTLRSIWRSRSTTAGQLYPACLE